MKISNIEFQTDWADVRSYINLNCIERSNQNTLHSKTQGQFYTWMFYLRRATLNQSIMRKIARMFIYKLEQFDSTFNIQLAGIETAGIPLVTAIPIIAAKYNLDLNAFIVKKSPREYGLKNIFEGQINDKPVVIIDDLSNSNKSLNDAVIKLTNNNISLANKSFVLVSRNNKLNSTHEIISLYNLTDFDLES